MICPRCAIEGCGNLPKCRNLCRPRRPRDGGGQVSRVSIGAETLRDVLALLWSGPAYYNGVSRGLTVERIERALARANLKHKPIKRKPKPRSKRDATSAVYAVVKARARGRCEWCSYVFNSWARAPELDHAHGRGRAPESAENCWLICRVCHQEKHDGPALEWLEAYRLHSARYNHAEEVLWTQGRILWARTKTALALRRVQP